MMNAEKHLAILIHRRTKEKRIENSHSPRTMNLYCLQFRRRVRVSHHEHQSSETTLTLVTSNWLRLVNKICKRSKSVLENIDQRNTPLYWTLSNPLLLLDLALVTFNKDVIYCFFFSVIVLFSLFQDTSWEILTKLSRCFIEYRAYGLCHTAARRITSSSIMMTGKVFRSITLSCYSVCDVIVG